MLPDEHEIVFVSKARKRFRLRTTRHFQWMKAIENVRNREIAFSGSVKETSH